MGNSTIQTPFGEINQYDHYFKSNSPEIQIILDNPKIIPGTDKLTGTISFNLSPGWIPKNCSLMIFRHEYANFMTSEAYYNENGETLSNDTKHLLKKLYPTYRSDLIFSNPLINKYNFSISIPRDSSYSASFEIIDQFKKSEVIINYFLNIELNIQTNNQSIRLSSRTKFDILSYYQPSFPSIEQKDFKLSKGIIFTTEQGVLRLGISVNNPSIREGDNISVKYSVDNKFSQKHIKSMKIILYEKILVKGIQYPDGNPYIFQKYFGPEDKIWANQIKYGILPGSYKEGKLSIPTLYYNSQFRNLCTSKGSKIQRLFFLRLEVSLETKSTYEKIRYVECPLVFYNNNYQKENHNQQTSFPIILNSSFENQHSSNEKESKMIMQRNLVFENGNLLPPTYRICLINKR